MINFFKIIFISSFFHVSLFSHCQIPCGIYSDAMQIVQIREDLRTIDKAMEMVRNLSKNSDPQTLNQVTRWISSKESHAQNIQKITAEYFLTQRIKQSSKYYENKLITLHQLLVSVMKCKQSVNNENVVKSNELLNNFTNLYFDDHGIKHLNQLDHNK